MTVERHVSRLPEKYDLQDLLRKKRRTLEILKSSDPVEIKGATDELVNLANRALRSRDIDRIVELLKTIDDFLSELNYDIETMEQVVKFYDEYWCKESHMHPVTKGVIGPKPEDILLSKAQRKKAGELLKAMKYAKKKLSEKRNELKYWKTRLITRIVHG